MAGIKAAIDKDGKFYSAALTAGDLLYGVTGGITNVRRLDSLAIGAANTVLTSSGTAPQWSATLTSVTLASPTLSGTVTGTPTWSSSQAITLSTAAQPNITSVGTLTSAAVSGTSTLGVVNASGLVTANAGLTVASGQTMTLTGATVAGTPTWSSSQAITLSTAAQPNITSVGTLTSLTVSGLLTTGTLSVAAGSTSNAAIITTTGLIKLSIRDNASDRLDIRVIGGGGGVLMESEGTTRSFTFEADPIQFFIDAGTQTFTTVAGTLITQASESARAGFRLPHGAAPSSPTNGDIWTTTAGLFARINGATVGPYS